MPVRPATQSHGDISLPAELTSLCDSLSGQNWRDTNIPWLAALTPADWQKVGRAAYGAARHNTTIAIDHIATVLLALGRAREKPNTPAAYVLAWFHYVGHHKHETIQYVSLDGHDFADPDAIYGSEW